jgi:hypothetical protein
VAFGPFSVENGYFRDFWPLAATSSRHSRQKGKHWVDFFLLSTNSMLLSYCNIKTLKYTIEFISSLIFDENNMKLYKTGKVRIGGQTFFRKK